MSFLNIRQCKEEDLLEVVALMKELQEVASGGEHITIENVRRIFMKMKELPEIYMNLVGEISGTIVGFISIIFYKTVFHKGGTALINELIITESQRGKGIGQSLIEKAKKEALKRGLDEIEVGTEKTNYSAQQFYRKCGFNEEFVLLGMEFEQVD